MTQETVRSPACNWLHSPTDSVRNMGGRRIEPAYTLILYLTVPSLPLRVHLASQLATHRYNSRPVQCPTVKPTFLRIDKLEACYNNVSEDTSEICCSIEPVPWRTIFDCHLPLSTSVALLIGLPEPVYRQRPRCPDRFRRHGSSKCGSAQNRSVLCKRAVVRMRCKPVRA